MTTCEVCQTEIQPSRHGRERRYCSERCRSQARRGTGRLLRFRESGPEIREKPPAWVVKARAGRIWKQYVGKLNLTLLDEAMFGALCCLMAEFQESPHTFPAARLSQLRGLGKSFGLMPGGRRGIRAEPPRKPDPGEDYFT